jgi:amino acid adenylation domain-containing protein
LWNGTGSVTSSGDLAQWTEDGEVIILGRNDSQVKLHGLRIELGEIEAALTAVSGVIECVAQVRTAKRHQHLCAWFTAHRTIGVDELRESMGRHLAAYMVPTAFMQLDAMPHTLNGKINGKQLPDIEIKVDAIIPPKTEMERAVFARTAEVLGEEIEFGITSELVFLGLTSLDATELSALLSRQTGRNIGMVDVMELGTVEKIAVFLEGAAPAGTETHEEEPPPKQAEYPLSTSQMGVYFECVQDPASTVYNIPVLIDLAPSTDVRRLETALKTVIDAHPVSKGRIAERGRDVVQCPRDSEAVRVTVAEVTEEAFAQIRRGFIVPFDLLSGENLYRLFIYKTPVAVHLLLDFHHIMFDGASLDVFLSDLCAVFDRKEIEAEKWTLFDSVLIAARLDATRRAAYDSCKAWYTELIGDGEGATQMPVDREGAKKGAVQTDSVHFEKDYLERAFRVYGVTGAVYFLAVLSLVQSRFAGTRQLRIATLSAGRDDDRLLRSFGMFVQTLPVITEVPGEEKVFSFMRRTAQRLRETLAHTAYPYTKINTDLHFNPQTLYAYQGSVVGHYELGGQRLEQLYLQPENPGFPLFVAVTEGRGTYELKIEYDSALFEAATVRTLLECINHVAREFAYPENGSRHLCTFSVATDEQRAKVASFFRDIGSLELPVALFEKHAAAQPDEVAIIARDRTLTYRGLNEEANRLAHALLERGLQRGEIVSFILHRTSAVIVSMLGIVKAGGAYLPIDPEYPEERIPHYVNDSHSRFLISDNPRRMGSVDFNQLVKNGHTASPGIAFQKDDPLYVIYTSGSTGLPKGVALRHESVAALMAAKEKNIDTLCAEKYRVRRLSMTTVSFDMFSWEVWTTLLCGQSMVLADDDEAKTPMPLATLARRTGANALNFTTARLQEYLKHEALRDLFADARLILEAGEKFPVGLYKKIRAVSKADVINGYGPSETTMLSNIALVGGGETITVGPPVAGTREEIMDIDGQPLPPGAVGELWIGGRSVGIGYLNRPELNAEKFVTRAGPDGEPVRFYKSGDLAKWTANGEIVVLGRNDGQVKLRGLRIELGEIENRLNAVPAIRQSVVKVRRLGGQDHLCAWYTAERKLEVAELRGILAKTLAEYMVPTAYLQLDDMPHTPNGKINARALPDPQFLAETEYVPPENDAEASFCGIFAGVLELQRVGAEDDFFQLGGTSLQVAEITMHSEKTGYEVSYGDVFAAPTPRALARLLALKKRGGGSTGETAVRDYDYGEINALLANNTLERFRMGQERPLGNLLITGAGGFLGAHILDAFLDGWDGVAYCLVRGSANASAEERLRKSLDYYFGGKHASLFGRRIVVVDGDITDAAAFAKLEDEPIDSIVNCAAIVKHFSAGTEIEEVNVDGVEKGVAFAKQKRCRYVQISTSSVAGDSVNGVPPADTRLDEQSLYFGQDTSNKYIHSKFLAERAVYEAILDGLDAKVLRAGSLQARLSDGRFQSNYATNNFAGQLKAYAVVGKIPYEQMEMESELSPVDLTARAMLLLAETPRECCLFHPYSPHSLYYADIIAALNERGIPVSPCEREAFSAAFAEVGRDAQNAQDIAPLIVYDRAMEDRVIPLGATNRLTVEVLLRLGFRWPLPESAYLARALDNLKALGFFE